MVDNGLKENDHEIQMGLMMIMKMIMKMMMMMMMVMMMMMMIRLMVDFGPFLWTRRLRNVDLRTMVFTLRIGVDLGLPAKWT